MCLPPAWDKATTLLLCMAALVFDVKFVSQECGVKSQCPWNVCSLSSKEWELREPHQQDRLSFHRGAM